MQSTLQMTEEHNYLRDLADIRSMMVRSTKFLSLSGWAGIMAGIYALTGSWIAWKYYSFSATGMVVESIDPVHSSGAGSGIVLVAITALLLSLGTAAFLSSRKARRKGEKAWNATSRQMLAHMGVPLVAGGVLMLIMWSKGYVGLMVSISLLFYGIALYNAARYTYGEIKYLGLIQIVLGLISSWFISYGLLIWALGFGVMHIIYGIHMHLKYER